MSREGRDVAVIGAGSFGTALAIVLAEKRNRISLWAREEEVARSINKNRRNPYYLADLDLPASVGATTDLDEAVRGASLILIATPSHAVRTVTKQMAGSIDKEALLVIVSKGIEEKTFMTMSQVAVQTLDGNLSEDRIGVLYGPSHAEEVALLKPSAVVASSYSRRTAREIQEAFMTSMFRVYLNQDIIGVEVGGSVKNIMAIAAGIADGLEMGDNAKAALMTRGLHEMKRMGLHMGASQDTFSGLSGLGDLVVTCTSQHSRNRQVGYRLGRGESLQQIQSEMNMVAEGVKTARSVHEWADANGVEMPITEAVCRSLFGGENPADLLVELMNRTAKEERLI
ncbi:MAG: NAD(P)H-dependent glycerol-3-phosphate dehydrogenase [Balneolaceae bacterium]